MRLLADRDATIAAQAGTITEQARLIERLVGQVEQLADRVCELDRRVGKDSTNSSWPSSSDSPYTKAIDAGGIWPAFTGVLMRDGYHGYTHLTQALHAWCGAHTLRDLRSIQDGDPAGQVWADAIATTLLDAHHAACDARDARQSALANMVAPGWIETQNAVDYLRSNAGLETEDERRAWMLDNARVPATRMGRPEEIASMIAYLCSAQAGYVTGNWIEVDGGHHRSAF
ncbi:SDR family oxidoreductase [Parafrankia sp. FMc2]|uniref:SDR family oxidoreductase n=1 Tax=Parafrankia sp. FMc2 TaxID=3233196 RepID=UPI0034D5DE28